MPLSVPFRGGSLPLPAVVGAVLSAAAWVGVVVTHEGARYVGVRLDGLRAGALRRLPRARRASRCSSACIVPEAALQRRARASSSTARSSCRSPGTPLDDDIDPDRRAAGRRGGRPRPRRGPGLDDRGAVDLRGPDGAADRRARCPTSSWSARGRRCARAKAVGEEYEGVEVATATVRARRAGRGDRRGGPRRGVQAIVLAAEEPSRIRGGALLGGRGGPLDNFVGDATKYVVSKAPCQVILTAPPSSRSAGRRGPRTPSRTVAGRDGPGHQRGAPRGASDQFSRR